MSRSSAALMSPGLRVSMAIVQLPNLLSSDVRSPNWVSVVSNRSILHLSSSAKTQTLVSGLSVNIVGVLFFIIYFGFGILYGTGLLFITHKERTTRTILKKKLEQHIHITQTELYINPFRLALGVRRKFLLLLFS